VAELAGVTAVLLKYRVPAREGLEKHAAPLQDVQRAVGLVRHRAEEWDVDPARVGVIGFSAGGHLCATLGAQFETRAYPAVDDADRQSCRPDFSMLIYPFYLTPEEARSSCRRR
jgi:acetyl esterase/lipase